MDLAASRQRPKREPRIARCEKWRRGGDSNPRSTCALTGFRNRAIQPLWHLSARVSAWGRRDDWSTDPADPTKHFNSARRETDGAARHDRRARKKSLSRSALRSAPTPSHTVHRWFDRSSSSTVASERTAPNFGSRAPKTTRWIRACRIAPAHMKQGWWYETRFSDITPRGSDRLVFASFQVVHGNVSQNTLTSQPTTTDALALLGHGCSGTGGGLDGGQSVRSNTANRR